jgi:hypothetical protein
VKELVLRAFFTGQELHIVHEQHIDAAVTLAEVDQPVVSHRVNHLVHEALGRNIGEHEIAIVLQHVMPDRVHQMRLA